MKRRHLLSALLALTLLSSCAVDKPVSTEQSNPYPPGVIDPAVVKLLPTGSYTIDGTTTLPSKTITIKGYVNFASSPDGLDCSTNYITTSTEITKEVNSKQPNPVLTLSPYSDLPPLPDLPKVMISQTVRTPRSPTWSKDLTDKNKPAPWYDTADPSNTRILLFFAPFFPVADFSPGPLPDTPTDEICSIALIPRVMKIEDGRLKFDFDRAHSTVRANRARWNTAFIDAIGVTGYDRKNFIDTYTKIAPNFDAIMKKFDLSINKQSDGSFKILQYRLDKPSDQPFLSITLTPAPIQNIKPVIAKTYFEKLAIEVKKSGIPPKKFLEKFPG